MSREVEMEVLHAMQDIQREGLYPSGDRVSERLDDVPEGMVRRARAVLVASGRFAFTTSPEPEAPDEPDGDDWDGGRWDSQVVSADTTPSDRKETDIAIVRILDGRGSLLAAIGTLAGLSPNAVKQRAKRARHKYSADEIDGNSPDTLDAVDRRYLEKYYSGTGNKAVQDWLGQIHSAHRRRPDTRTA